VIRGYANSLPNGGDSARPRTRRAGMDQRSLGIVVEQFTRRDQMFCDHLGVDSIQSG
jgi:hypothetical protein